MTERILILTMATLGIGLSTITPIGVTPGLVKGIFWLILGIASK